VNAFATNPGNFTMKRAGLRAEKRTIEAADMHGQHDAAKKVTAKL
jgi:hypothetical protein